MPQKLKNYYVYLLGLAGLILLFLIYQQLGALKTAREQLAVEQNNVSQAKAKLQSVLQVKDQALSLQEQLDRLDRIIPPQPQEDILLAELEMLANQNGMELLQVSFENYQDHKNYVEMPIKIALEGDYFGLLGFLNDFQTSPRAQRIDEVKVGQGNKELPRIRVDISASTFYLGKLE